MLAATVGCCLPHHSRGRGWCGRRRRHSRAGACGRGWRGHWASTALDVGRPVAALTGVAEQQAGRARRVCALAGAVAPHGASAAVGGISIVLVGRDVLAEAGGALRAGRRRTVGGGSGGCCCCCQDAQQRAGCRHSSPHAGLTRSLQNAFNPRRPRWWADGWAGGGEARDGWDHAVANCDNRAEPLLPAHAFIAAGKVPVPRAFSVSVHAATFAQEGAQLENAPMSVRDE